VKLPLIKGLFLPAIVLGLLTFAATKLALKLVPDVKAQSDCCSIQPPRPRKPQAEAKVKDKSKAVRRIRGKGA